MSEENKKSNLEFWESVGTTDIRATKQVSLGRKFTAIDAHSQILEATKKFGMFGSGWGVYDNHIHTLGDGLNQAVVYQATLFWKLSETEKGEFTIEAACKLFNSSGKIDDDAVKKAATDALTKGLSKLGFNADVFLGKFDDNKYVEELRGKADADEIDSLKNKLIVDLANAKSKAEVVSIWTNNPRLKQDDQFKKAVKDAGSRFPDPPSNKDEADNPTQPKVADEGKDF